VTPQTLSVSTKAGWAVGELAIAVYVGLNMAFMLYYCTDALRIPPAIAGMALLVPRILDAFADPVMGIVSDRTVSRFGRRRLYLAIGAPFLGLAIALVFFVPPEIDLPLRVVLLMAAFLLSNAAITIYGVPYSAMAAEMTADYAERTSLTGYKMIAARTGIILSGFAGPLIFRSMGNLADGFRLLGVIAGIFMLVTGLWSFFATRSAPQLSRPAHKFNFRAEVSAVLNNRPFRLLWLVFLLQNIAIGAATTALIYFLIYAMRFEPRETSVFFAASGIAAAVATPVWVLVSRRLGKRNAYSIGLMLAALVALSLLFVSPSLAWLLLGIVVIGGLIDGGNQLLPNAMVPDSVEVDEAATGERREGAIFGAWSFCLKLGMTMGAFAVSLGLSAFGFAGGAPPAAQSDMAILGIRLMYAGLPALLWIASVLLLSRYNLTEERFEALKAEAMARRTANGSLSGPVLRAGDRVHPG
jgi:sugar (glycoside-pentoside-hexuronide) transporter